MQVVVTALVTGMLATGIALLPAGPAAAAGVPSFVCTPNTVYSVDGSKPHTISKLNPTTGSTSSNGKVLEKSDVAVNALALPAGGGRYIYAFNRSENQVVRFDATTEDEDTWGAPTNVYAGSVVAGAINPANGIYYYASGGSPWRLFAFNTVTNTALGQVGTITGLSSNGDMAFDAVGNLFVVSNASSSAAGTLARVSGPLPTTAGTTELSSTSLATLPGDSGQYASMAFDASGVIVVGTSTGKVLRVNATTGASLGSITVALNLADMASCAVPTTATARVNLPAGRYAAGDQFTTAVTGGGITTGNTGTTAGDDTGLQNQPAEMAGPVVVAPGGSYTVTQTAAGGASLGDYATTWSCVLESTGAVLASGSGSSGSFTVPTTAGSSVVCTFTNTPLLPALELDKTGSAIADLDGNGPDAGDRITYSFTVTNTGNVALDPVTVTDTKVGAVTCPAGALAPGASRSCTPKDYTITQAEVTAGKVDNTATAQGTAGNGRKPTATDSHTTPVPVVPLLVLDKTAGPLTDTDGNGPDAGDTVTYGFKVTNTGNVPLNPVTVSDPKVGPVTCPAGALAPGDSVTCSPRTYPLTQADVNAGKVDNTATAEGTAPGGAKVTSADSVSTPAPVLPGIALDKRAGALQDLDSNGPDAGDTIVFSFTVTNTGNVPLSPVAVSDPKVGPVPCPVAPLAPGASASCPSVTYQVTQADVNAGKVDNTATVTGTPPSGPPVTGEDSTTTMLKGAPAVELDKTASAIQDVTGDGIGAGDKITYGFAVTNTGTVTLDPVTVSDPKVGPVTCPSGALPPGQTRSCQSVAYLLTQADVDAGRVDNTATASGTAPGGAKVTDPDSVTTPVPASPAIAVDKTAGALVDGDGNGPDAGDTVTYSFTVTNTGNVTLDPVKVLDPKVGPVSCPSGPLAPGASRTCTPVTYPVTQADANLGRVDNTATAEGTAPGGSKVIGSDSVTTPVPPAPSMKLVKTAGPLDDKDGNGPDAGDTISYGFTVTNTGNVTLTSVKVADPKVGQVTCSPTTLAPGGSASCSAAPYVVTQADMDLGAADNLATATGTTPGGGTVGDDDATSTPLPANPAIRLVKGGSSLGDVNGNGPDPGDTITYTFTVTNTGNVTLSGVTVSDPKVGPVTCPGGPLAPGSSTTCTPRVYAVTQEDINAGEVVNTATARGAAPGGAVVEDDDSVTVDLPATASIALAKSAGELVDTDGNGPDAGDTITYSFVVTNTGPLPLTDVAVTDPLAGPVSCPSTELAPAASQDCDDVVYVVTAGDVTAGRVDNVATAVGTPPTGPEVSDTDSTSTPVVASPANVQVEKVVDDASPRPGETVTYTLTATNTGVGDARDVVVTDHLPSGVTAVSAQAPCDLSGSTVTCPAGTLVTGATRSFTVRATVNQVPKVNTEHQHWLDVQKTEVHVDLGPGEGVSGTAACQPGYVVTDGSGRLDHVDQGTGTWADLAMTASHAVGTGGWRADFVNRATGRAQAKVFAVCVKEASESVNDHTHGPVVGGVVTETRALPQGRTAVTLSCAAGERPLQPGFALDGVAAVLTSHPAGENAWTWVVDTGDATEGTFTLRCLDPLVSTANAHRHGLRLDEVRQTATVPPGATLEVTVTCAGDAKGIVGGHDLDPGLLSLGNDPRPIIRVFKLHNPTGSPLTARLSLLCLGNRTGGGADSGATVVNLASVVTSSPETATADNTDTATFTVDTSAPATVAAPTVTLQGRRVAAPVRCGQGQSCSGVAELVMTKTRRVSGTTVRKGTVLAKARYSLRPGRTVVLKLRTTRTGKLALRAIGRARLDLGDGEGATRKVRIR